MFLHQRNILSILFLQFIIFDKTTAEDVMVTVDEGTLLGATATSIYNTTYTAFIGIPYAEPPLGELRFEAPNPSAGWDGVRNATQYGSDCVQEDGSGSEDCLYLNVYVPGVPEEGANLPVMFWVHGGGFIRGGGSDREYGPDFLVSYGVILVTINYRLGQLGYLSTGDEVVAGNAGSKDQLLALSWVQRNIAKFGGDPQLVTVFGESSGSICVSFLLVSPLSAGLFSRVILQSGNFVGRPSPLEAARRHAFRLGAALGFATNDSQQLVDFLRSANATDLVVPDPTIMTEAEAQMYQYATWAPHVEPELEGAFITVSPIQALINGQFHRIPVMAGVTSAETGYKLPDRAGKINDLDTKFVETVGPNLHLPTVQLQQEAALKMREFYFGNGTISAGDPEPLVNFANDLGFFEPTEALLRKVTEIADVPAFYYELDYQGENVDTSQWGVNHAADLSILFLRQDAEYNFDPESEEDQLRRNIIRYWTNFAKYGNPTPEADPVVWEPYNNSSRRYMRLQANFTVAQAKDKERMDFWFENVPLLPYADEF